MSARIPPFDYERASVLMEERGIDMILVGMYQGYYSDISRVAAFGATPDADAQRAHAAILEANAWLHREAGPGVRCGDLHHLTCEALESRGYRLLAPYAGHGIGRDVHEPSFLGPEDDTLRSDCPAYPSAPGGKRVTETVDATDSPKVRAQDLHRRAMVLLSHDHLFTPADFAAANVGGITARVVMPFVDVEVWGGPETFEATKHQEEGTSRRAMIALDRVLSYVEAHPEQTLLVRSVADLFEAKRSGRAGIILGSEGGRLLEGSLELLRCYHRMGLRQIQFNWDFPNRISACQNDVGSADSGLTDFGRDLVKEMNRLGMLMDTSHSSHRTRLEVFELSQQPITHGHAGAKSITDRPQNLSDDELKALAANGGVIGLHFFSRLINRHGPDAGQAHLEDLYTHIDHIARVAGMSTIALGPDWFPFHPFGGWTHEQGFSFVDGLASIDCLPTLTRGLLEHGYRETDIEAILGGNLLRVLRAVLPAA